MIKFPSLDRQTFVPHSKERVEVVGVLIADDKIEGPAHTDDSDNDNFGKATKICVRT